MIGQTISHYRIVEKLGEGGMGVVYKAEDTKLKRTVALKFLHHEALENPGHKKRFLQEAQAAAALTHPNVCTIYEIDEVEGRSFIAMEWVEGQSVKQKIEARPLKLSEALDIAVQVAEGLHAAHEQGVVHRDIKPSNLIVTPRGQVKVMDFGLAQLVERTRITEAGTKLGTPAYMSPEQVQGEAVDRRTDVWSLGVLFYEMVSGQLPFKGDREAAVAYTILHEEPEPLTALRVDVPVELDRVVRKAMTKDPGERYQHVDEMLVDLRALRRTLESGAHKTPPTGQTTPLAPGGSRREDRLTAQTPVALVPWRRLLPWGLVVVAVLVALGSWFGSRTRRPPAPPVIRTSVVLPLDQEPLGRHFAISPDGTNFVYKGRGIDSGLYLRELSRFEVRPLTGTEGANRPFFSPDGQWVGFSAGRTLQRVPITGGAPVKICDLPTAFTRGAAASWGPGDWIVYDVPGSGLLQVPVAGGEPTVLTELDIERGENRHTEPQISPDGKDVFFTIISETDTNVGLLSLDSKQWTLVSGLGEVAWARYLPTGHLVYASAGEVLAVPFDLQQAEVTGPPRSLLNDIDFYPTGHPALTISENGLLAYNSQGPTDRDLSLMWVERDGHATLLAKGIKGSRHVRLSPDGSRVVEAGTGIWTLDVERGNRVPLSEGGYVPVWTPDGGRVAFTQIREGPDFDVYWRAIDGTGGVEPLLTAPYTQWPTSFSPDGKLLAFFEDHPQTGWDIGILSLEGEPRRSAFLNSKFNEFSGKFSPNGDWMAYVSDESGRYEVYVRPYPGPGPRSLISTSGGVEPVWSPDGGELFYRNGDQMLAASITTEPRFRAGQPVVLFEGPYEKGPVLAVNYDVSRDGKRFLMLKEDPGSQRESSRIHFNLVLNWFEEVKRLVPPEE